MRFHRNRSHVIDLIFPLAVLFVFAASSLVVLILSVHIYTGQTEQAEAHYRTDTPLSYVEEKIRQNDVAGSISVMTLDGTECPGFEKFIRRHQFYHLPLCIRWMAQRALRT